MINSMEQMYPASCSADVYKRQAVVGGAVSKNYFPAVEKGIAESVKTGPVSYTHLDVYKRQQKSSLQG